MVRDTSPRASRGQLGVRLADPALDAYSSRSLPFESFSAASDLAADRSINSSRSEGPRAAFVPASKTAWAPHSQTHDVPSWSHSTPSLQSSSQVRVRTGWAAAVPPVQGSNEQESSLDYVAACEEYALEYNRLGRLALSKGDIQQAEATFRQALELVQRDLVGKKTLTALTFNNIGCLWRRKGKPQKALEALEKAMGAISQHSDPAEEYGGQLDLVDVHLNMSAVLSQLERHDGALLHVETAVSLLYERTGGSSSVLINAPSKSEKDLKLLAVAHYNCGAEQQFLGMHRDSLLSFQAALDLSENYLPPHDPLHSAVRRAHANALRAAAGRAPSAQGSRRKEPPASEPSVSGRQARPDAGGGIPPLRLSHLHGLDAAPDAAAAEVLPAHHKHTRTSAARLPKSGLGGGQGPFGLGDEASQRSVSTVTSIRHEGTSSGRSDVTPDGWHALHGVHRGGSWGAAARMSGRRREKAAEGRGETTGEVGGYVRRVRPKDGQGRGRAWGGGGERPGRVDQGVGQSTSVLASGGRGVRLMDSQMQTTKAGGGRRRESEDSVVSAGAGLEGSPEVVRLMLAAPLQRRSHAASRYLPQGSRLGGLFDYEGALAKSMQRSADAATQVDPAASGDSTVASGQGTAVHAGSSGMRALLADMISTEAANLRRSHHGAARSLPLPGGGWSGRPQSAAERTYKGHLQRTREAQQRYDAVAMVVQLAYRCHQARRSARQLRRNPRHLRSMYVNQIHAFAGLIQSNVRCMLARLSVGRHAAQRHAAAEQEWRQARYRAALRMQAWWTRTARRLAHLRDGGGRRRQWAGRVLAGAWRGSRARRAAEAVRRRQVEGILSFCETLESDSARTLQRALRCHRARAAVAAERRQLDAEPELRGMMASLRGLAVRGLSFRALPGVGGAASPGLSAHALRWARKRQERAAAAMQVLFVTTMNRRSAYEARERKRAGKEHQAALVLQGAVRGRQARHAMARAEAEAEREDVMQGAERASGVIQRAVLCCWARRECRDRHSALMARVVAAAARELQRSYRVHLAREEVRRRLRHRDFIASQQRRRGELALRLQMSVRCWRARARTVELWRAERAAAAAVRVQQAARCWLARNEFQAQALTYHQQRMHTAALALQLWSFANPVARQRPIVAFWRAQRERAAQRIGAVFRGHGARTRVWGELRERRAARGILRIQRVFRGHQARRTFRQRWAASLTWRENRAAMVVQRAVRCREARHITDSLRSVMAQRWRTMQELHLQRQVKAVQAVQAYLRCALSKAVVRPMMAHRDTRAVLTLNRVLRGHLGRKQAAEQRVLVREMAGRRLQRAYRVHLARSMLRRMVELRAMLPVIRDRQRRLAAADTLQRAFLMHLARAVLRERAQDLVLAAVRRGLARRAHRHRLAAATLQTHTRRAVRTRRWRRIRAALQLAARLRAGVVLRARRQSLAGSTLSAGALGALTHTNYRRKLAADTLSAGACAWATRGRYARKLGADTIAAVGKRHTWNRRFAVLLAARTLQRMVRGVCGRLRTRVTMGAAVRLQSTFRGHLDRRWLRAHVAALEKARETVVACIHLQAVYKGHLARAHAAQLRLSLLRAAAARVLQSAARCGLGRNEHAERLTVLFMGEKATQIQRIWRGALAKARVRRIREHRRRSEAATEVQRVQRGHDGRNRMRQRVREIEEERAAVVMQAVGRGYFGRQRARGVRRRRLEAASVLVLQAGFRGMEGRAVARQKRLERLREWCAGFIQAWVRGCAGRAEASRRRLERRRRRCALRVQACQRGHRGRAEAQLMRDRLAFERELRNEMAMRIQSSWRLHEARKRMVQATEEAAEREFLQNWYAVELQSCARQFLARAALRRRTRGIVHLQAHWRRQLARRKADKRRQLFKRDRAYTPPHIARPDCYEIPPGTNLTIACRKPKPPKKFRAEATPEQLRRLPKMPSGPDVKQKRAVEKFQRDPRVQSFFTGLKQRDASPGPHAKHKHSDPRTIAAVPTATPAQHAPTRPKTVPKMPKESGEPPLRPLGIGQGVKGRLPPRFAKNKAAQQAADGSKPSKARPTRQRPRARGSDSERESDPDMAPPPVPPARPPQPVVPFAPAASPPKRATYDKDAISDDPQSDTDRKPRKPKPDASRRSKTPEKRPTTPEPEPSRPPAKLEREGSRKDKDRSRSKSKEPSARPQSAEPPKDDKVEAAFRSCLMGKYHEVEKALEEGVGVNARHGPDDNTMLLVCAANGQKRIAKHLLRNRADINAVNAAGNSALHLAFQVNYKELGEYLKSKGANDTLRNQKGQTCYELAKR